MLTEKKYDFEYKVVFANTGLENDETLDFVQKCSELFNVEIVWIESNPFGKVRYMDKHKVVNYETATRNQDCKTRKDTPYEQVVQNYGIPNLKNKISTRELKLYPIQSYMHSIGWYDYYTCIGIRSDEIDRVSINRKENKILYPLVEYKPFTKKHVNFWWSQQPFRLNLKGYQGNCVSCYKKSEAKLLTLYNEDPANFEFFDYLEQEYGYYLPQRKIEYYKKK